VSRADKWLVVTIHCIIAQPRRIHRNMHTGECAIKASVVAPQCACAYSLQQQENMRLLAVITMVYALINGNIIRTLAIFESKLRHVYLTKMLCIWSRVLSEVTISTETMTVLLRSFRCRSSSSVFRTVGHPG